MSKERSPKITSRIMSAVRSKDTRPEIALRSALWRRGLRFRKWGSLEGKPDLIFAGSRIVVFVDGDFWHGNAWRVRGYPNFDAQFTYRRAEFWRAKIERNMARDREVKRHLKREGWKVIRVWESDILKNLAKVAERIDRSVRERRS